MNVETKLQDNYYSKKDSDLYHQWVAVGKIDPATGKRVSCPTCYNEFQQDALQALNLTDHPKAGLLFQLCWQDGHASGYQEVWDCLLTWCELLEP